MRVKTGKLSKGNPIPDIMRATLHAHPQVKAAGQVIAGTGIIALVDFEHHDFFLTISTSSDPPTESRHYHEVSCGNRPAKLLNLGESEQKTPPPATERRRSQFRSGPNRCSKSF